MASSALRSASALRGIPTSDRHFWKTDFRQQHSQVVKDYSPDYEERVIPQHEVLTLALNEICFEHMRGFFQYLPIPSALTSSQSQDRIPAERSIEKIKPGNGYAPMIFVDVVWDHQMKSGYSSSPHRARYLRSNFLINPPPPTSPCYPIQYSKAVNMAIPINTAVDGLGLLETEHHFYLASITSMVAALGRTTRGGNRVTLSKKIFSVERGGSLVHEPLRAYLCEDLKAVYDSVVTLCSGSQRRLRIAATADDIRASMPRARVDMTFGTNLGQGKSSDHKSRREEYRKSNKRSHKAMSYGDDDMGENFDDDEEREI